MKFILLVFFWSAIVCSSCASTSPATEEYLRGLRAERGEEGQTDPLSCFNKAIQLDSTQPEFFRVRSYFYSGKGKFELAAQDLSRAIDLSPKWYYLYYDRALCFCRLHHFSSALNDIQTAIQGQPNNYQFYSGLALILLSMEKPVEALNAIDKALATKQPSAQWKYQRGIILSRLGRREDAIEQFASTVAVTLAPRGNEPSRNVYYDGAREFEKSRRLSPEEILVVWTKPVPIEHYLNVSR